MHVWACELRKTSMDKILLFKNTYSTQIIKFTQKYFIIIYE